MLKKIFTELFSSDAAQAETTTHTASASLSANALHDLECRKRAIVADITRLAQELAACSDLGAPIGGLANPTAAAPNSATATATFSMRDGSAVHAAGWLGRGEPWTGERASTSADLASANLAATVSAGGPYPRPDTLAEAVEYFAQKQGAK